jgi:ParB/RepB/Spo0J family partition protein
MAVRDLGTRAANLIRVDLKNITIDPGYNVRQDMGDLEELARQITENGQCVPGKVRPSEDGKSAILVDGHRRYKAIQLANEKHGAKIDTFLCTTEEKGANEESRIVDMFMYNTGKALTLLEQAEVIVRLQKYGWAISKIAKTIGKPKDYIDKLLVLNGSTHSLREAVRKESISPTAALMLAGATAAKQESVLEKVRTATIQTTPKGNKSKAKALKVKDVEKALKGLPATVSTKKIRDIEKEVEALIATGKHVSTWKAVQYGLQLATTKVELDPEYPKK